MTPDPAEAALLAAILETPEDDVPRGVLADWLDEHSERERAEFVRVQLELDKPCTACDGEGEYDADHRPGKMQCRGCFGRKTMRGWSGEPWDALRERERELLRAHWLSWLPESWLRVLPGRLYLLPYTTGEPLPEWVGVEFRRGFVDRVTAPLDALLPPCGRCEGNGEHEPPNADPDDYTIGPVDCSLCLGTGRDPGVLRALFGAQPVTSVTASDRGPGQFANTLEWFWIEETPETTYFRFTLPGPLFRLLGTPRPTPTPAHVYPTRAAALAALSVAVVAYGRSVAGLRRSPAPDPRRFPPAGRTMRARWTGPGGRRS